MLQDAQHSCLGYALGCAEIVTRLVTNYKNFFEVTLRIESRVEESGERYGKGKEMLGEREQKEEFLLRD